MATWQEKRMEFVKIQDLFSYAGTRIRLQHNAFFLISLVLLKSGCIMYNTRCVFIQVFRDCYNCFVDICLFCYY